MTPSQHDHHEVHKINPDSHHHDHHSHNNHEGHSPDMFRRRFWVSAALSIPTLLFSPMVAGWFGLEWSFWGSGYIAAVFGTAVFLYGGTVFLKTGVGELRSRQPGMMTLISMAIIVAFMYSLLVTTEVVSGMDFWWELVTLITVMLLGHWIEMRSVQGAQNSLDELSRLLPDTAEVLREGQGRKVPLGKLKVGDIVLIRPGSKIPIDGVVTDGDSHVDESMLTGESKSVAKSIGNNVTGGTVNTAGSLTIEVSSVGDETVLAGIMKLVKEASQSKSNTQILADKFAGWLFYIAVAVASLTAIGWSIAGAPVDIVLERVVTVLIVACPHALGLAIPLVVAISTTRAVREGILIRKRQALERIRFADVVIFDKTGTLTEGRQGVIGVVGKNRNAILGLAAAVERYSEHPIAQAIVSLVDTNRESKQFMSIPGKGVSAEVDGSRVSVGNEGMMKDIRARELAGWKTKLRGYEGKTLVYVARDREIIGCITLEDVIRNESLEAVRLLRDRGVQTMLVTGDNESVARSVSARLGIDGYKAGVLPGGKAEIVRKLQNEGRAVVMVGDGVNDAPALTQADVGVAIGAGTDVAIESADIILITDDPRAVARALELSTATHRKMKQNLAWATGYNVVALPLAAGVAAPFGFLLSPVAGAIIMSLSTIIVAINAQTLRHK